jgi:hypothetical protein
VYVSAPPSMLSCATRRATYVLGLQMWPWSMKHQRRTTQHRAADMDASYAAYDQHAVDEPDKWGDPVSWRNSAGTS